MASSLFVFLRTDTCGLRHSFALEIATLGLQAEVRSGQKLVLLHLNLVYPAGSTSFHLKKYF